MIAPDERPLAARIFERLADGQFHSGERLGHELALSRSAVWKATASLRALGVELHAVRHRGYRLSTPCEPLDRLAILEKLDAQTAERIATLEVVWQLASTNDELLARPRPHPGTALALLAEHQRAGRGRRGRQWLAPPGAAVCCSVSWTFAETPRDLSALSLAIGVCVVRALQRLGARDLALKWPNDVLHEGRKLAGVLLDLRAEVGGSTNVVAGIGLNCALPPTLRETVAASGLAPTDLRAVGIAATRRNEVAARLITDCIGGLSAFEHTGAEVFLDEWRPVDAIYRRAVSVQNGASVVRGVASGIDASGALLLDTPRGLERFVSGDVSVRFDA